MEIRASLDKYRKSAKKIREIIPVLRGMEISEAESQLENLSKGYSVDLKKLLASAVANTKNNHNLKEEGLVIKDVIVEEKPVMKRWMPRAYGRAAQILKRTSRVEIVLEETQEARKEREAAGEKKIKEVKAMKEEQTADIEKKDSAKEPAKGAVKEDGAKKGFHQSERTKPGKISGLAGQAKKVFRRKSI